MSHERLKSNFKLYVMYIWKHLRLPNPTKMQLHIADYLEEGHERCQLQALRGIGKTYLTASYVTWRLLKNPDEKILIVSQSGYHAKNILKFIRSLISSVDILAHLNPNKDQRDSAEGFDVAGSVFTIQPSVKALGVTAQLQGNRASLLIADDVEGKGNSATEHNRLLLLDRIAEFEAIKQTNKDSQIIFLGTPQTNESIYNKLKQKGYVTRIYPARYPEDISVYDGCLADYLADEMLKNPELVGTSADSRFSDEDLYKRELSYGKSGFQLQFMLDTSLSDEFKFPLKTKDFIVLDLNSNKVPISINWSSDQKNKITNLSNIGMAKDYFTRGSYEELYEEYDSKIMVVDPSGRGKDETGWAVLGTKSGNIFIIDFGGIPNGYEDDTLEKLSYIAMANSVNLILIEANFGDGMFCKVLQPVLNEIYPCTIEEIKHSKQKELRIIDTLEPILNQHRLAINYSSVERDINRALSNEGSINFSFIYQLTHITRERHALAHDDKLDAVAMGVGYYSDFMFKNNKSPNIVRNHHSKRLRKLMRQKIEKPFGEPKREVPNALKRIKSFSRKY